MSNYKRKKPRTKVKCIMCTSGRHGNSLRDHFGKSSEVNKKKIQIQKMKEQLDEQDSHEEDAAQP